MGSPPSQPERLLLQLPLTSQDIFRASVMKCHRLNVVCFVSWMDFGSNPSPTTH